jgi:hypothetical protein
LFGEGERQKLSLERTYVIEQSPEEPLSWKQYEQLVTAEWTTLLNRNSPPSEKEVQSFLERHPSMVPGAFGFVGGESGHYPRLCGLITQPSLPSYDRRVPDFMWLAQSSDTEEPVLVEIEAPSKRWFTKNGKPTASLTQALQQITDWKAWSDVPRNAEAFKAFYGLDQGWHARRLRPSYLLIYGRRAEANADLSRARQRSYLFPENVFGRTFDRLQPNPKADDLVCLKAVSSGVFEVVSVPPTLRWRPMLAGERGLSSGWDTAILANPHIPPRLKEFLVRRRGYWDEWGRRGERGVISTGDEE